MTLEQLILNVELQGNITIKVYDYTEEDYCGEFPYTTDQHGIILDWFGAYYIKFIYPEHNGVIIEISAE